MAGLHYQITRSIEDQMVFKSIRFTGGDLDEPREYQERVKLYDQTWFEVQLKRAGLRMEKCYGNYLGRPYSEKSERLLIDLPESIEGL
jgi:hypothetical protein